MSELLDVIDTPDIVDTTDIVEVEVEVEVVELIRPFTESGGNKWKLK